MPSEIIGEHEIEFFGVQLAGCDEWAATVAIYGPSPNPMHRNNIFPSQRVSVNTAFATEALAEQEAHKVALSMLD